MIRFRIVIILVSLLGATTAHARTIGVNVLLNRAPDDSTLADLGTHGEVLDVMPEIFAVTMRAKASELQVIQALPYVVAANADRQRSHPHPGNVESDADQSSLPVPDFADGANRFDLDAINVTDVGGGRMVAYDGAGVY